MDAIPQHAPYMPMTAGLGGQPTTTLDSPITAVFLALFAMAAATHMTIYQVNRRRGRKFAMSAMLFGFCMARIVACTMRLVWASHPHNISVAIASQIFVAVGVIIFFIVNIVFVQRVYRASHPHLGWAKWFSALFTAYYVITVCVIVMLITSVVQSFYTLNKSILPRDHKLMLFGSTYFAVAAFLPIPLLAIRAVLPPQGPREDFGSGRFSTKIIFLLIASTVLTLGAAFRAGTAYVPRPLTDPAWYDTKACFYLFDFTIDFSMAVFYAVARVDKLFIVPNGSSGPGDYSRPVDSIEDGKDGKDAGVREASGEEAAPTAASAAAASANETTPAAPAGLSEKTEAEVAGEDQAVPSLEPVVQRETIEETKPATEPRASTEAA